MTPRFAPSHSALLSGPELVALTGLKRASAQVRWLQERGWVFAVRADGSPAVATAEFDSRMCSRTGATGERRVGPDLAALDRLG